MRGFTLFEILIVMGIVAAIAAFGLVTGIDTITRGNIHAERDTLVRLLEVARNRSMNNIGGAAHGVRITEDEYVVFSGASDVPFPRGSGVEISGDPEVFPEVIFEQLSGRVVDMSEQEEDIKMTQGPEIAVISINEEGGISW